MIDEGAATPSASRSALLFPAALAALGMVLVLAREIRYGPALFPDSLEYLSAAQNFADGKGLINVKGDQMAMWPPLYPLLLAAAGGAAGIDLLDVAGPLNAVLFGLTVFAAGRHLQRRLESRFAPAWACAVLALSLPLTEEAAWVESEPLFMALAALALIQADKFLSEGRTRSLVGAAAYGALACQARYIGVAVPVFTGLALLFRQGAPPRRKARSAAAVWLAAGLSLSVEMLRHILLVGAYPTNIIDLDAPLLLRQAAGILWGWTHFDLPAAAAPLLGAAALVAAAVFAFRRGSAAVREPERKRAPIALWSSFALIYLILLAAAFAWVKFDTAMEPRYLAPLYLPAAAAAAVTIDRLLRCGRVRKSGGGGGGLTAAVVMAALCLWTAGQAAPSARHIEQRNARSASTWGMPDWFHSATLRYVRENPLDGVVYSGSFSHTALLLLRNKGAAAYRVLRTTTERNAATGLIAQAANPAAAQQEFESRLQDAPDGAWVVLFKTGKSDLIGCGDAWLRASPTLQSVAQFPDGCIARVRRVRRSAANPYRAALRAAVAGRRVTGRGSDRAARGGHGSRVGGGFDVSWRGKELIYIKQGCSEQDARTRFFLHVWPQDETVLAADRKPYGMDNLDFHFRKYGVVLDGACVALRPLPDYAAARIRTGQFTPERGALWQTEPRLRRGRD